MNDSSLLEYYDYDSIKDIPQVTWIIKEFIPNNGLIILYGSPGCGKTFIVLDICLHIINKKKWFNNEVMKDGIIIYLIGEGINGIKGRLDSWSDYYNIKSENCIYFIPINSFNIWEDENINKLKSTISKLKIISNKNVSMIIVDTLARASTGLDENSSRDMGKFLKNFEKVKDIFQCSILFIHHKGKDESKGMRGSSSLLGAVDTCIDIKKLENNKLLIKIDKQKDGENKSYKCQLIKHNTSLILKKLEDNFEYDIVLGNNEIGN